MAMKDLNVVRATAVSALRGSVNIMHSGQWKNTMGKVANLLRKGFGVDLKISEIDRRTGEFSLRPIIDSTWDTDLGALFGGGKPAQRTEQMAWGMTALADYCLSLTKEDELAEIRGIVIDVEDFNFLLEGIDINSKTAEKQIALRVREFILCKIAWRIALEMSAKGMGELYFREKPNGSEKPRELQFSGYSPSNSRSLHWQLMRLANHQTDELMFLLDAVREWAKGEITAEKDQHGRVCLQDLRAELVNLLS